MGIKKEPKSPLDTALSTVKALRKQNADLRVYVQDLYMLFREQSAFTHGVLVCELIDNPSENKAYEKAMVFLGSGMAKAQQLLNAEGMK